MFNLLPAVCDIITLIYVEQAFGILYIKQSLCILKFNSHEIFDILNGIIDTGTLIRKL